MARALCDLPRVCPYLHLPFQSGSDRVLASMRRGYTRQQYLDTVALLRDRVPGLSLSSDVIVGYPGETESEFEETLAVVEAVGFDVLFSFTYSPRPGTAASACRTTSRRRRSSGAFTSERRQQEWQRSRHETLVGRLEEVLVETIDGGGGSRVARRTSGSCTSTVPTSWSEAWCAWRSPAPGRMRCRPPFASTSLTVSSAVPIFCATGGRPAWKSR